MRAECGQGIRKLRRCAVEWHVTTQQNLRAAPIRGALHAESVVIVFHDDSGVQDSGRVFDGDANISECPRRGCQAVRHLLRD